MLTTTTWRLKRRLLSLALVLAVALFAAACASDEVAGDTRTHHKDPSRDYWQHAFPNRSPAYCRTSHQHVGPGSKQSRDRSYSNGESCTPSCGYKACAGAPAAGVERSRVYGKRCRPVGRLYGVQCAAAGDEAGSRH